MSIKTESKPERRSEMRRFGILAVALAIMGLILALGGLFLFLSTESFLELGLGLAIFGAIGLGVLLVLTGAIIGGIILLLSFGARLKGKYSDEPPD